MSNVSPELLLYIKFASPPIIGALIGYLTNRVAIRMLFRPLVAWKIGKVRVPMTPGVIPSKREDLACNMGEVVGDHLLTSEEVGKGLQHQAFQDHLHGLIHNKINSVLGKDLASLGEIIPQKFQIYGAIGKQTVTLKLHTQITSFLGSKDFEATLTELVDKKLTTLGKREVGLLLPVEKRERAYAFLEQSIARMFNSESMEQWVDDFVHNKVLGSMQKRQSLNDILPGSLPPLLIETIEKQVPALLKHLATMVGEPAVRDRVVRGACAGVENFIDSLGSMADMVRGFLRMDMVEGKIREYLIEKNDDIVAWLQSEEVQDKFVSVIRNKSEEYLQKPLIDWMKQKDEEVVEDFCRACTNQILLMVRGEEVAANVASMIRSNLENHIESGSAPSQKILADFLGEETITKGRKWVIREILKFLRSPEFSQYLDAGLRSLMNSLYTKRIGKLSRFIPQGIVDTIVRSIRSQASNMLAAEIPGIVHTLNISRIVTEKINSLDLLQLERLLLSIMEEQFKYINLFGALLGFLIGCINTFVLFGV